MRSREGISHTGAFFWALCTTFLLLISASPGSAQSSDQSYPTAITENEISGRIRPRDVGDPRQTTYFYTFNGRQGDLFVNVVTKNLSGDIDIFIADGLRPLTKLVVYADLASSETGRVLYLRKPEKLILRVEGRTPNDDPAEFHLKFAGSFEAAIPTEEPPVPKVSDLAENDSGVRVNSVGTIIAVNPRPKPTPKAARFETGQGNEGSEKTSPAGSEDKTVDENTSGHEKSVEVSKSSGEKTESVVVKRRLKRSNPRTRTTPPVKTTAEVTKPAAEPKKSAPPPTKRPVRHNVVVTDSTAQPPADPLAGIDLVIIFKDGRKIQRPMTEVLRFTVDHGTLTVVSKNGTIAKYSILDVASVTIR